MHQMSQFEPYSPNFNQLAHFHDYSLNETQKDCFSAMFCLFQGDNLRAYLNINAIFHDLEIDFICVDQNYRKHGLGKMIFQFFLNYIEEKNNFKNIFLEVGIFNKAAIEFYKKYDFQIINVRKKYYKNNEDAYVMQKNLS
jgi:ribosomal-protein-alanine N-acetyltransferase